MYHGEVDLELLFYFYSLSFSVNCAFFLQLCSLPFHYIWNVDTPPIPHGVMMSCTKITGSPSDVSEGDTDLKE